MPVRDDQRTGGDPLARVDAALGERYRIARELGRGGAAIVYLAEDRKHRRQVAIKVLKPELAQALGPERFLREIDIAARLSHPNILPIHDSGLADGLLYYVMPFVEGESLRDRMDREKQLPVAEAVRLTRDVAGALAHAHAAGVIHRDIKPANILLQSGHAIVSDFGIARALEGTGVDRLTDTGLAVGTPTYMSPEQAAGDRHLDARGDIYSLGCVLYEMLAGDPPYTGSTPQALLARKATQPPPRLRTVRDSVPVAVEAAVMKALARVPADRYGTAEEFSDALDRALMAKDDSGEARPRRRLAMVGVLVVAIAGVAWWSVNGSFSLPGAPRLSSLAVLPFEDLSGDTTKHYFAAGMHDAVIGELSQIGALRVISRRSVMRYQNSEKSIPEIARELNVDGVVEASVSRSGDSVRLQVALIEARPEERSVWRHLYAHTVGDMPRMHGDVAQAIAREVRVRLTSDERTRLESGRPVDPATYEAYLEGMFWIHKGGLANVQRGLERLHAAVDRSPGDPHAYAGLAQGYAALGHGPAALPDVWPRVRAAAIRAVTLDSTLAEAHTGLAEARLYYEMDWAGAEQSFHRALDLNPNLAMAHYHYAWYLALMGRLDEAIASHKRAQELDPLTPVHTAWLGTLYRYQGQHDAAIEQGKKALELNPNSAPALVVLGENYAEKGMFREAIEAHERLVTINPAWKGTLAETYVAAGRTDDALRILAEIEAEKPSPWRAYSLATLYASFGRTDDAFAAIAYDPPHSFLPWIAVDPKTAPLRADPRFAAFVRRLKLPQS